MVESRVTSDEDEEVSFHPEKSRLRLLSGRRRRFKADREVVYFHRPEVLHPDGDLRLLLLLADPYVRLALLRPGVYFSHVSDNLSLAFEQDCLGGTGDELELRGDFSSPTVLWMGALPWLHVPWIER